MREAASFEMDGSKKNAMITVEMQVNEMRTLNQNHIFRNQQISSRGPLRLALSPSASLC